MIFSPNLVVFYNFQENFIHFMSLFLVKSILLNNNGCSPPADRVLSQTSVVSGGVKVEYTNCLK